MLRDLRRMGFGGTAGADQFYQPRHHRDEPFVILAHPGEQLDLVASDELQPLQIVAELVQLAQRAAERTLIGREQRCGDMVELRCGVELDLSIGGDLPLQLNQ